MTLTSVLAVTLLAIKAVAQDKGTIYYLSPALMSDFESASREAIVSFYGELGYEVVLLDAQNSPDVQLRQLLDAAELTPDAIILNAVDVNAVVPGIEKVRAAGVPVLNYGQRISTTKSELTSIPAMVEIGRIAAREAIRLLAERYGDARGKLLHIQGDFNNAYTQDILVGFDQVLSENAPNIELLSQEAKGWDPSFAAEIFQTHISMNPDVDLVFCDAARMIVPIVSLLQSFGKEPGDVLLMGLGGPPAALENIRAGWQQVAIDHPLYAQVYGLAMFTPKILNHEPLKPGTYEILGLKAELIIQDWGPILNVPGEVITSENVDDNRFWGNSALPHAPVRIIE